MIKTNLELVEILKKIANEYKTLYVMGCFGAPMNEKNKERYCNNHSYNKEPKRTAMIKAASSDTFGFDCVCLIKGVLWGWNGDVNKGYGGAVYVSNGVPDVGADGMIKKCLDVSKDFSKIEAGEAVWKSGHIGVYIGNGLAVECTPSFKNKVQITAVKNLGTVKGYDSRTWTSHGKLPYISYENIQNKPEPSETATEIKPQNPVGNITYHTVKKGDTLSAISKKYSTTVNKIVAENKKKYPKITANYIVTGWILEIIK